MNTKDLCNVAENNDFQGVIQISNKQDIIFQKAYGYMDRANHISNNIDTKFGIASGTKLFTALAILKLIDENKLSFDSNVMDIIDYDFSYYSKNITVYELLNHLSGMPDYFDEDKDDEVNFDKPWYEFYEPYDYLPFFPKEPMRDKEFKYNNGGYVLLAAVISKISGRSYSKYVKDEVFDKYSMKDSGFYPLNELPANTALGYIGDINNLQTNIYKLPIVGGGDGGVFTTTMDMMIMWNEFLNGRIVSDNIVSKYLDEYPKHNSYFSGMWRNMDKNLYYLEGCDMGVSFSSIYNKNSNDITTIISNTTYGAWKIKRFIFDSV